MGLAKNYKRMKEVRNILKKYMEIQTYKGTARHFHISKNTVKNYVRKCKNAGVELSLVEELPDSILERIVYSGVTKSEYSREQVFDSQVPYLLVELRKRGVTRQLLWEEYRESYPKGYGYSQFCDRLGSHITSKNLTLTIDHKPAEKVMLDYAGGKMYYYDEQSGEQKTAEVLVAVLPHSQYTFAIALPSQRTEDFVYGVAKSLEFFGGTPRYLLSDNLKAYVTKANRYEPQYNELSVQLAAFYDMDMQATRVAKPKDKASVENMVRTVYSRLYAPLRDKTFYSIEQINTAFIPLLESHNEKSFQKRPGSRKSIFEQSEQDLLSPLPSNTFEIKNTTKAKIQKNYHAFLGEDKNFYSVPFKYVGKTTTIVYTRSIVEIYHKAERIAIHNRLNTDKQYCYITNEEHQPKAHRIYEKLSAYNDQQFMDQANNIGEYTHWAINHILTYQPNQDQAYKSCLGILGLGKRFGNLRLEKACLRCQKVKKVNYRILENMLSKNLDKQKNTIIETNIPMDHKNIRGANCYN